MRRLKTRKEGNVVYFNFPEPHKLPPDKEMWNYWSILKGQGKPVDFSLPGEEKEVDPSIGKYPWPPQKEVKE